MKKTVEISVVVAAAVGGGYLILHGLSSGTRDFYRYGVVIALFGLGIAYCIAGANAQTRSYVNRNASIFQVGGASLVVVGMLIFAAVAVSAKWVQPDHLAKTSREAAFFSVMMLLIGITIALLPIYTRIVDVIVRAAHQRGIPSGTSDK
jgi:hypothetical protein